MYHRDLKPPNIFVLSDGRIKIGDFGGGKILADFDDGSEARRGNETGTRPYLPPEAFKKEYISFESDIWAVGCILHELASGWFSFWNGSKDEKSLEAVEKHVCE